MDRFETDGAIARYIIPTPFSAYAFDTLEAYVMSLPIYAYSFLWPMSREAQLIVFVTTNIWTILLRMCHPHPD
jgi:lathosterol oxidase